MDLSAFAEARGKYRYVPARLILAGEGAQPFTWGGLNLVAQMPSQAVWDSAEGRSGYSSIALDEYHQALLNSSVATELLHGLASAVFWGYASGSDHVLREGRAVGRVRWLRDGKKNSGPQPTDEIVRHIQDARALLKHGNAGAALVEMMKIKFLGMSFASKILMFIDPKVAAVYDAIISERLNSDAQPNELRAMHVPTNGANRILQAQKYAQWCAYCSSRAASLNGRRIRWADWDKQEFEWRAVDVERAFFAMGR